jgi:hypothetical protein
LWPGAEQKNNRSESELTRHPEVKGRQPRPPRKATATGDAMAVASLPPTDPNGQPWPPPRSVHPALRAARRRYQVASPVSRPVLTQPQNCLVLFTLGELIALARARYWPLPELALAWIAEPPRSRRRRRRRWIVRVEEIVRRVMVEDLPAAVRLLTWGRNGQQTQNGR